MNVMINGVLRAATFEEQTEITLAQNVVQAVTFPALTPRRLWLAALAAGVTEDMVINAVRELPEGEEREWMLIELRKATSFEYEHPAVETLRQMMGIPLAQFNTTWQWASTL